MTDDHLDELASAHLDGATSPAEAAALAAAPDGELRVERLVAVRARLQDVGPIDPTARDAAIAAALAAATSPSAVTSLASVRAGRAMSRTTRSVIGAVAAVVLLALVIPVIGRLGASDDAQTASERTTARDAASGEAGAPSSTGDAATADGAASPTTTTTATASARLDLGSFTTLAALLDAAEASATLEKDQGEFKQLSELVALQCAATATSATASSILTSATATVGGASVAVMTIRDTSGVVTVRIFRTSDCALLAERPLSSG